MAKGESKGQPKGPLFHFVFVLCTFVVFGQVPSALACGTRWIVNGWFYGCAVGFRYTGSQCCQCSKGQYQDTRTVGSFHNQRSCKNCSPGEYQNAVETTECIKCSAGKYSAWRAHACTDCLAGQSQKDQGEGSCDSCSAGRYAAVAGSATCAQCSAGRYSSSGSASCSKCEAGEYSNDGASGCRNCNAGRFAEGSGNPSCSACPEGRYQNSGGKSSCAECPAGQYQASRGRTSCSSAPAGKYAIQGATSAIDCPPGKYSSGFAAKTSNCDGDCNAGTYCAGTGNTSPNGNSCPAGKYGRAGESDPQCTGPCSAGFYCPAGTGINSMEPCGGVTKYCEEGRSSAKTVDAGYFTTPETAPESRREGQSKCPLGHYCTGGKKYSCPAGRYGSTEQQTSSQCEGSCFDGFLCEAGSSSPRDQLCSNEDPSYYCEKGIRKQCPEGSYTTPESPDTSTRSGCEPCPGPEWSCINGIRSEKTKWVDDFCKANSEKVLFVEEVVEPSGTGVDLNGMIHLELRTPWVEMEYSVTSVTQNGRDRAGAACEQVMETSPFAMKEVDDDSTFNGIPQEKAELQVAPGQTLRFATCDQFDVEITTVVTEVGGAAISKSCTMNVIVQHKNSPPEKVGGVPAVIALETMSNKAHGETVGDQLSESFTDPDADELSFRLVDENGDPITADNQPFALGVCSGQFSVSNAAVLSQMPGQTVTMWVLISDNYPGSPETLMQQVTISIRQPNRPPIVQEELPELFVVEGTNNGVQVGTVGDGESGPKTVLINSSFIVDPDGDTLTVELRPCQTETYCDAFALTPEGVLTVKDNAFLSFDAPQDIPRFVRVFFSDGIAAPVEGFISLEVQQLRRPPEITTLAFTIEETATGTIGNLQAEDENGDGFIFSFEDLENNLMTSEDRIALRESGELVITTGSTFRSITCGEGCTDCMPHDTKIILKGVTATITEEGRTDDFPGPTESNPVDVVISITVVNEPPVFLQPDSDITMKELMSGEITDISEYFCDREENRMFYELVSPISGEFANYFSVGGVSGILEVRGGYELDFEDQQSHVITVKVEDNGSPSQSNTKAFTVQVVDVPEPPKLVETLIQINETTTDADGPRGQLDAIDPDTLAGTGTYSSSPSMFKFFQRSHETEIFVSESGSVSVANGHEPDYETMFPDVTLEVEVLVYDFVNDVNSTLSSLTVEILDIEEPPSFSPRNQQFTLPQFSGSGTEAGVLQAVDPDLEDAMTFELISSPDFLELTSSGRILLNNGSLDLVDGEEFSIEVVVTDLTGLSDTATHTVTINNPPSAPTWGENSPEFKAQQTQFVSIDEHHEGVYDGFQPHCVDPNEQPLQFQILQSTPQSFEDMFRIDRDTGKLEVLSSENLDFERLDQPNGTFLVACVDSFGLRVNGTLTVVVNDIEEAPKFNTLPESNTISTPEDEVLETVLDVVGATDVDANSRSQLTFTISLKEGSTSPLRLSTPRFEENGHDGIVDVILNSEVNFFERENYDFVVEVEDESGLKDTIDIILLIEHVNEEPVFDQSVFRLQIYENITSSSVIATDFPFSDRDIPAQDSHTFGVLSSGIPDLFEFREDELRLVTGKTVDFEQRRLYEFPIIVTDSEGLNDTATIEMEVLNVNDVHIDTAVWGPHDTNGGSNVTFFGVNFGSVWQEATISAILTSADEDVFIEASCTRSKMGQDWNNVELLCSVPPGVGKGLAWDIQIDEDKNLGTPPVTSYAPPIIEDIPSGNWPSPATTEGGQTFVLKGKGFGPVELRNAAGNTYPSPLRVSYRTKETSGRVSLEAVSCSVQSDTEVSCVTSEGIGNDFEFHMELGKASSSWLQETSWTSPANSLVVGYSPPVVTSVVSLTGLLPTTGSSASVGIHGLYFGNSMEHITSRTTNGDFEFAATCETLFNHSYVRCNLPAGAGQGYQWSLTVAGQVSELSTDSLNYDPPVLNQVLDVANRVPVDMDTEGNQIVKLTGKNLGPEATVGTISVRYGLNEELQARDCEIVDAHFVVRCTTSPGVGKDHSWIMTVASQDSNTLFNLTNYHPPVVATYRRPGLSGIGIADLKTKGDEVVILGGNHFGPPNTVVQSATYGSGNESFIATSCEVIDFETITCKTVPGAGARHFWSVVIGEQESILSTTSYKPPEIISFEGVDGSDPSSLYTEGGELLDIIGKNFGPMEGETGSFLDSVSFGRFGAEQVVRGCEVKSHTRIRCPTLRGFGQHHRWVVVVGAQTSQLSTSTTSYAVPRISNMSPTHGKTGPKGSTAEVVLQGTDLGNNLLGETTVIIHVDNEGKLNRLHEQGKIVRKNETLTSFLTLQQENPARIGEAMAENGLPVDAINEWLNALTKIVLNSDNLESQGNEDSRSHGWKFTMPQGFGASRALFVQVGATFSLHQWFDYDAPVIVNVAPSLPIRGRNEMRVVVDGQNFCEGSSCITNECCGKLIIDGEIIEVSSNRYDHQQIVAFVEAGRDQRTLSLKVLDQPEVTESFEFRQVAPSISNQESFMVWPPFDTSGTQRVTFFDASGVTSSAGNNSEIVVTINERLCTDLRVDSTRDEGPVTYANFSCRVPANVGHDLPVSVEVDGIRSPNGEAEIDYAGPTVCFVSTNEEAILLYKAIDRPPRCDTDFPNLKDLVVSEEVGVPTVGANITVHGLNLGSSDLPPEDVDGTISIESTKQVGIPPLVHTHSYAIYTIPAGAGGILGTEQRARGRRLASTAPIEVEFYQAELPFVGSTVPFTFSYNRPTISGVEPSSLPTEASTDGRFYIFGTDFGPAAAPNFAPQVSVTIGEKPCQVVKSNQSVIECIPPSGQGEDVPVFVSVEGQEAEGTTVDFNRAVLTSISPSECPTSGLDADGNVVNMTVLGTDFGISGRVEISTDGIEASGAVFTHSQVTFPCPEGFGQDLQISLLVHGWELTEFGSRGSINSVSYSYEPPEVTGIRRVRIKESSGTRSRMLSTVFEEFDEGDCDPIAQCSQGSNSQQFCIDYYPTCFPTTGEVPLMVQGLNFASSKFNVIPEVTIGGLICTVEVSMSSQHTHNSLICMLAAGVGKDLDVQVKINGRASEVAEGIFAYDPPQINAVMPNTPDAEGDFLLIRGANFGPKGGPINILIGSLECQDPFVRGHDTIECTSARDTVGPKGIDLTVASRTNISFPYWMEKIVTRCSPDWYGIQGEKCLFCPDDARGAVCPGGERHIDLIYSEEGWWRINETEPFERCHEKRRETREECPTFLPCEPKWACTGNNTCATGYRGSRCSDCLEGSYFRINGECQKCPNNAWLLGVGIAVAAIGGAVGGYIINTKNIQLAAFTIGIDYFQVLAMFARTRVQWPTVMEETLKILSFFNFNLELAAPECYLSPAPPFELKWMATMGLPLACLTLLGFVYFMHYMYKLVVLKQPAKKRHTHLNALIATFLIVFYILYLFLTRMTLDVFNCTPSDPPDGNLYMSGMTDIICFETPVHVNLLLPLAALTLVIYVAAFPILSYVLLKKNKERVKHDQILRAHKAGWSKLTNPNYDFRKRFQRLYYLFKPGKWYWIILILMRKFLIALTSLMFRSTPSYQLAMSLLVIFAAYAMQVKHEPYLSPKDYQLIVNDHLEKVAAGDKLHMRIQAIMTETKNKNSKEAKKSGGWNEATAAKTAGAEKNMPPTGFVANVLMNYNTVETILLGCAIIVNLAGIMFLSGRFQGEQRQYNTEEFELLGVLTMVVVVISCAYFFCVFAFELLNTFAPSHGANCLKLISCGKATKRPLSASSRSMSDPVEMSMPNMATKFNPLISQRMMASSESKETSETNEEIKQLKEDLRVALEELRDLKKEKHRESLDKTVRSSIFKKTSRKQQYGQYVVSPRGRSQRGLGGRNSTRKSSDGAAAAASSSNNSLLGDASDDTNDEVVEGSSPMHSGSDV